MHEKTKENKKQPFDGIFISISMRFAFFQLQFHFAEMAYLHDITYELQWTAFVVLWFINTFLAHNK